MQHTGDKLSGTLLDERISFSLQEFSQACGVGVDLVMEMVREGVLEPVGAAPAEWLFSGTELPRALKALRLTRDLHVNWSGVVLALDLLEEVQSLRRGQRATYHRIAWSRWRLIRRPG